MEDWEATCAIDTLKRAKEIEEDPAMMKAVKAQARREQDALREIAKQGNDRARRIGGMTDA